MQTLLIVDDHPVLRLALKSCLQERFPGLVVGEAGSAAEALAHVRQRAWGLCIIDIVLPDRMGLDALEELRQLSPQMRVLVFSAHHLPHLVERALQLGAAGFVCKGAPLEQLYQEVGRLLPEP